MPHQCVECGEIYPDGDKQMLSGCDATVEGKDCDGNQFQFVPENKVGQNEPESVVEPHFSEDKPEDKSGSNDEIIVAEDESQKRIHEDSAQRDARTGFVDKEDLPSTMSWGGGSPDANQPETDDDNLESLREELNEQFGSIRIVAPGQYQLNLRKLYEQEEYIITLREDGRYIIETMRDFQV